MYFDAQNIALRGIKSDSWKEVWNLNLMLSEQPVNRRGWPVNRQLSDVIPSLGQGGNGRLVDNLLTT